MIKLIVCVFILLGMSVGCSSVQLESRLKFNLLVMQNNSGSQLENVKIKVEKTGALASCSVVLPGTSCSTGFPARRYQKNPIYIYWTEDGQSKEIGPLLVEPPEIIKDQSATALLEFDSYKQVSARFVY